MRKDARNDDFVTLERRCFSVSELEKSSAVWPVQMGIDLMKSRRRAGPASVPHFCLVLILEGQGELISRQQTYPLEPEAMLCLFPQEAHEYYAVGDQPIRQAWIAFEGPQAYRMLEKIGLKPCKPAVSRALNDKVMELFGRLMELADGCAGKNADLSRIIVFHMLFEELSRSMSASALARVCSDSWLLQGKEYIEAHYLERITVESIADYVKVDRAHFTRKFHQEFGITPAKYLQELRIREARRLLERTDLNLSSIAQSIGYTDMFTFSKAFKKLTGLSPREYRSRLSGDGPESPLPRAITK